MMPGVIGNWDGAVAPGARDLGADLVDPGRVDPDVETVAGRSAPPPYEVGVAVVLGGRSLEPELNGLPLVRSDDPISISPHISYEERGNDEKYREVFGYQTQRPDVNATQAQTPRNQQTFSFQALGSREVEADFSGGYFSSDVGKGTLEALKLIVAQIRKRHGNKAAIIIRADSGFCRDDILTWIESQPNVHYVIGLARNAVLQKLLAPTYEPFLQEHLGQEHYEEIRT